MAHNENFKNESQDARRKDEHNLVHPDTVSKHSDKPQKESHKSKDSHNIKSK